MIHFIHISMLIGLTGVLLPILIHLLARQKLRRIEFSTTYFLKSLQNTRMHRIRLRQALLLVLRSLSICCIALAFARPTCTGSPGLLRDQARSSVVLLVDRSLSMKRTGLFENAQVKAVSFLDAAGIQDECLLLWSVPVPEESSRPFFHSGTRLREKILETAASSAEADLSGSLRAAVERLQRSENVNQEIALISDMQESNFDIRPDSLLQHYKGTLFLLPVAGSMDNVAVTRGGPAQDIHPGMPFTVGAAVHNFSERKKKDTPVRLMVSGRAVAQKVVNIEPGREERVAFQVTPERTGWISGEIVVGEDPFEWDNRFYFAAHVPDRIRVLLIGADEADVHPFELALNPGFSRKYFELDMRSGGQEWGPNALENIDVAVLSNYPYLNPEQASMLKRHLDAGKGLFILLGPKTDLRNLAAQLTPILPGFLPGNRLGSADPARPFFSIGTIDTDHPLFQGVFERGRTGFESPKFFSAVELSGGTPVMTLSNGGALLAEFSATGRVLVLASAISGGWSDLAVSSLFAPLMHRIMATLSHPFDVQKIWTVGEAIQIRVPAGDLDAPFTVAVPSGVRYTVVPRISGNTVALTFDRAYEPGNYTFFRKDECLAMTAVNCSPRESDMRAMDREKFEKLFPEARIEQVEKNEDIASSITTVRWGHEWGKELFMAALLLLLVEMAVGKTMSHAQHNGHESRAGKRTIGLEA